MAEEVGFEPTVRLHAQRFSRPPRSTTLAPLRGHPYINHLSICFKDKTCYNESNLQESRLYVFG